jgi:hypothetical protein
LGDKVIIELGSKVARVESSQNKPFGRLFGVSACAIRMLYLTTNEPKITTYWSQIDWLRPALGGAHASQPAIPVDRGQAGPLRAFASATQKVA